ncbi:four-carbon acid sugar kinase family protein [Acrocarpospora macrocephala]|uniref:3-oxo-tetronate kinase n=1 Tax=Acrocarpospora macrocephala TaxID=150177 RepID=A0A5M3WKL7_9ACTN|nr:3-oxo-tetronate kinase [Acrocarpospora macrocephala]GES09785.1 HPr kinase [Acrocarpospora macrocephala]
MSSPALGCVADDYTGGTDVAAALRRAGLRTVLLFGAPPADMVVSDCDAIVVSLKTRTAPVDEAVAVSLAARRWLVEQGVSRIYLKYCSTFDSTDKGNIGPTVDAFLEAGGAALTVVCPASPEHGRTVYQGHLFVGDRLLSESPMRHHPLTPMTDSDLVRVLGRQTPQPVGLIPHEVISRGGDAVRDALDDLKHRGVRHVVTDAVGDRDLDAIARATAHLPVVTGAAGLARATGALLASDAVAEEGDTQLPEGPAIVIAGSCSAATLEQVARARRSMPSYRLRPESKDMIEGALRWLEAHLGDGPVMVYSSAPPEERLPDSAELLEQALAAAARHAVELGARRVVVAGGETSGAVVSALGVASVVMAAEEDRGVPWVLTSGVPRLALLLKSGNFGRPDLLVRAVDAT